MQCQVISKIKRPHVPKHSNLAHNYASLRMDIKLSVIYIKSDMRSAQNEDEVSQWEI